MIHRIEHLVIADAKHPITLLYQKRRAALVVPQLQFGRMGCTIDFDDELATAANKVGEVWPNGLLANELQAVEAFGAELLSELGLGQSGIRAKLARST